MLLSHVKASSAAILNLVSSSAQQPHAIMRHGNQTFPSPGSGVSSAPEPRWSLTSSSLTGMPLPFRGLPEALRLWPGLHDKEEGPVVSLLALTKPACMFRSIVAMPVLGTFKSATSIPFQLQQTVPVEQQCMLAKHCAGLQPVHCYGARSCGGAVWDALVRDGWVLQGLKSSRAAGARQGFLLQLLCSSLLILGDVGGERASQQGQRGGQPEQGDLVQPAPEPLQARLFPEAHSHATSARDSAAKHTDRAAAPICLRSTRQRHQTQQKKLHAMQAAALLQAPQP